MRFTKIGADPRGRLLAAADTTRRQRGGPAVASRIHVFDGVEARKLGEIAGPELMNVRIAASGEHVVETGTISGFTPDGHPVWSTAVRPETLDAFVPNPFGAGIAAKTSVVSVSDDEGTGFVWLDARTGDTTHAVSCAIGHRAALFAMGTRSLRHDGSVIDTWSGAVLEQLP